VPIGFLVFNVIRNRRQRPDAAERERYEAFWERMRSHASGSG
jgi:hypothetical protein